MSDLNTDLIDLRVLQSSMDRGLVTSEQYEATLEELEDCAELGEETETRMDQIAAATAARAE
jgi:hypothetical protein